MAEDVPKHSHGRGGAGNIATDTHPPADPSNFVTPSIKTDHYTTGRGGSGNIAKNDPAHPEIARAAQDVGPVPRGDPEVYHTGRGGAANVGGEKVERAEKKPVKEEGIVEKGKEFLGKLMGQGEKKP